MAGITHLQEIYTKKGKEFIDNLFGQHVIINEKIDLSRFSFQKNKQGQFEFFKRNTDKPIDKVDRTLMVFYESAINYIESLPEEIKIQIPANYRFGMEYGVRAQSHEITYDRLPKNNLILSDILIFNEAKTVTIQDKKTLDEWADMLNIERAPILFEGTLSEEQKLQIVDFLNTPFVNLVEQFKTTSFVRYIISILNPALKETALNNDIDKPIEGLVFRFGTGSNTLLAKLVDPLFTEIAKSKAVIKKENNLQPNDIYNITLADVTAYMSSINLAKVKSKGKDSSEKYIGFISQVFNNFITVYGDKYKGLDFNEPEYMKKSEFNLNYQLITNEETKSIINAHPSFESLYRIILNAFRKKKTKRAVNDIFSETILNEFNSVVEKIETYLTTGLVENEIPTFGDFHSNKFVSEEEEDIDTPEEEFQDISFLAGLSSKSKEARNKQQDMDSKKIQMINYFTQPTDDIKTKLELQGTTKCNVFIGRFQPFHNGHLKTCLDMKKRNGLPVVLVLIHTGTKTEKNVFSIDVIQKMVDVLLEAKLIDHCVILPTAFFGDIYKALRPDFEPLYFCCGEDRLNSYEKQVVYMRKNCPKINILPNIEIVQIPRIASATEVRSAIRDNDYDTFKKFTPKPLIILWELFKSEI